MKDTMVHAQFQFAWKRFCQITPDGARVTIELEQEIKMKHMQVRHTRAPTR